MATRVQTFVVGLAGLLIAAAQVSADDAAVDLKPLVEKVREVVERHYPQAKVSLDGKMIHFESNVRKFWIHDPNLFGEWQEAYEDPGPKKGGVWCDIELRKGTYMEMAALPQTIDKRYFLLLMTASSSKKLDHYLLIHLKYPRGTSKEFLEEFQKLIDEFDKHATLKE